MPEKTVKLDLKAIPVFERHPRIFDTWDGIEEGDVLQLINDHDPKPLYYQFVGEQNGKFEWAYVTEGPDEWVVNIKKLKLPKASPEELQRKVNEALGKVRPYLQADGGDVELVGIDDVNKTVTVKLTGACGGCPSAAMTLKSGVESTIKKFAPEIKSVNAV